MEILLYFLVVILLFAAFMRLLTGKSIKENIKILGQPVSVTDNYKARKRVKRREIENRPETRLEGIKRNVVNTISEFKYINPVTYAVITLICAITGFFTGTVWNNVAASFILASVGAIIPYLILRFLINKRNLEKDEKLVVLIGDLQSELINTMDFITAVKNRLGEIRKLSPVLYEHFKWFYDMIKLTPNDNIPFMEELADRVDNKYFKQYMKMVIRFTDGQSSLVYTMQDFPREYAKNFERYMKHKTKIAPQTSQFITTLMLLPLMIGMVKTISEDFYTILTHNILGQVTLVVIITALIIAAYKFSENRGTIRL